MIEPTINFTFAPGTTVDQMVGFEVAGLMWSQYLSDQLQQPVDIYVETGVLDSNIAGGAIPELEEQRSYQSVSTALEGDVTSVYDQQAFDPVTGIQVGASVDVLMTEEEIQWDEEEIEDRGWVTSVETIDTLNATTAASMAMGNTNASASIEGYIMMNTHSDINWGYDYRSTVVASDAVDWLSVAIHEVGHNLGFVSGLDSPGLLTQVTGGEDGVTREGLDSDQFSVLDLFRYTVDSAAQGLNEFSMGDAFFSIDGGTTSLADFSPGEDSHFGGDGFQGSHWKQDDLNPAGIMDPKIVTGVRREITALDLIALDVMGWDLRADLQDGIAVAELGFDLGAIVTQAEERLAGRLGTTVTDMYANAATYSNQISVGVLMWDRSTEVQGMLLDSDFYEWGWGGGYWQNIADNVYASTITLPESNPVTPSGNELPASAANALSNLPTDVVNHPLLASEFPIAEQSPTSKEETHLNLGMELSQAVLYQLSQTRELEWETPKEGLDWQGMTPEVIREILSNWENIIPIG